jgi:putative glutamine amidotransferase
MVNEKSIKAVILSGGGNISRDFPSENFSNESSDNIDLNREIIEKSLINFSLRMSIPLIGICRGMQALGMFFGGKLSEVENHVNTRHTLQYYCPILKKEINRNVNSYHDFGFQMNSVPEIFQVNAKYLNLVEQMVHKNEKMLGLMWHPEREAEFCKLDVELFRKFLS